MFRVCREIPISYKQVLIQVVPATRLEPCQTLIKKVISRVQSWHTVQAYYLTIIQYSVQLVSAQQHCTLQGAGLLGVYASVICRNELVVDDVYCTDTNTTRLNAVKRFGAIPVPDTASKTAQLHCAL